MIIDNLKNSNFYNVLGKSFKEAFDFLQKNNLEEMECGKYEIKGKDIFVSIMEYTPKSYEECLWEAHRKYIDVQYIISGSERMGYINIKNIDIIQEYNEKNDILFGIADGTFIDVNKGEFVIFTPEDAHMPSIKRNDNFYVKKAVVKISIQ